MGGKYDQDDILMWATPAEIKKLKDSKLYTGSRF